MRSSAPLILTKPDVSSSVTRYSLMGYLFGHLVNTGGAGKDHDIRRARLHLDAVGVAHAEPLFGNDRDRPVAPLDLVFVFENIPLRNEFVSISHMDLESRPHGI